ncbi:MAG: endonuclease MutS2 [Clostridiales bacterium]|nr:endonuclease MutS2 [Clostridiales bacterium]
MEQRTLQKLEYPRIIEMLASYTSFAYSRQLAGELLPAPDGESAGYLLAQTSEARELMRLYPTFSLGGLHDIRGVLHHAAIGGSLDIESLLNIDAVCRASRLAKKFFSELKGGFPLVSGLGKGLGIFKTIETALEKSITPDGSISDNASERLYQIRRKIRISNERIKERLEAIIKGPSSRFLQDALVTIRDGRYVVPVKQEYRSQVPGVSHDVSASGATIFIEPLVVMEQNNELQKLLHDETEEIAAILRSLTMVVLSFQDDLLSSLTKMARLDLILAKGRLSAEMDGSAPKINQKGYIRLLKARHPLIDKTKVVPVDLRLEQNVTAMVITGPNTGGKTVTLKTVGLLTAMALAGLHIPAEHGSELSFFKQIFADIGDEQSIEQSLSTFSAHMVNIVKILQESDDNTLVLLDELGAGTDPTEGAALAMSILDYLKETRAKVVATTHYSELKAFAYNNPGFINASVEFDLASLAPTYKLLIGVPGKSNAFEIARRLGLSENVISRAGEYLRTEDVQVTDLLANLEQLRRELAGEREALEEQSRAAEDNLAQIKAKEQALEIEQAKMIREANLHSQKIIEDTIAKSQKYYEEFMAKVVEEKAAERAWQESRRKLKTWQEQLEEQQPKEIFAGEALKSVKVGDTVYIPRLNQHAFVLALPDSSGEVALQIGILKMMIKLEDLRHSNRDEEGSAASYRKSSGGGEMSRQKSLQIKNEIDLRGLESREAIDKLDKYIDDAFIASLKNLRIIHGKGTGALRAAVGEYLSGHRLVKTFAPGDQHDGGMGVTVVELDL